jgi:hypothetical protein
MGEGKDFDLDIGFVFKYFGTEYTQVSISSKGYVCLGNNSNCDQFTSTIRYNHILFGLHHNLDPKRNGSGQIYYKKLNLNSLDFASAIIFLNLFNPKF